jgi:hypothetical protein
MTAMASICRKQRFQAMTPASNPSQLQFSIRTFQFRELAQYYFPLNTPDSAAKAFRRLIRTYKGLPELLAAKGFIAGSRIMAPSVVEVLVKHLGAPE